MPCHYNVSTLFVTWIISFVLTDISNSFINIIQIYEFMYDFDTKLSSFIKFVIRQPLLHIRFENNVIYHHCGSSTCDGQVIWGEIIKSN